MQGDGDGLESPTSFGYVDLDGFAEINNEHGHVFGDKVLESVIEFGEEFVNDGWEFNREYGQGDEFLVVMAGVRKESATESKNIGTSETNAPVYAGPVGAD